MIAAKLVAMCILLISAPQQTNSLSPDASTVNVSGTCVFSDGQPLAKVELEFNLTRRGESSGPTDVPIVEPRRCETDAEGNFQVLLDRGATYSATVVARRWMDGDLRQWRCSISELSSDAVDPIKLTFENRGRIFVAFLGTSNLPSGVEPSVLCTTPGSGAQVRIHRVLEPDSRGRIVIDGLEPREYLIEVFARELRAKSWNQSVTVPAEPPYRGVAQIQFPEFKFGSFKAIVVLPDGKSPAADTRILAQCVDEQSLTFGGTELMTDSAGVVSARMNVGEIQLRYVPEQDLLPGVAPAVFHGKVEPDVTTDLGKLRLPNEEEVFAWVEGTIHDSTGKSPEGIIPRGKLWSFTGGRLTFGSEDTDRPEPKPQDESFNLRVRPGEQVIALGLGRTKQHFGGVFGNSTADEKQILMSINLSVGERLRREVIVPLRSENKDLKVTFEDSAPFLLLDMNGGITSESEVNLLVELSPGVVWRASGHFKEGVSLIENVPAGKCLIILSTYHDNYIAARTIAAEAVLDEVHFSREEIGELQITIKDLDRMDRTRFTLELSIDSPFQSIPLHRLGLDSPQLKRAEDGSFVVGGIAPGEYHLTVSDGAMQFKQDCEIAIKATTKIQF